ncbi:MAG: sugar porter family MFS transporter [Streptococcaceae bacterium]|jgi:sugar porter (SP) family MFS transporter|nr:sugar porter family MFS transporter [Streptococcaceae bacterium]
MKIKPTVIYFFGALGGLLFGIDSGIISGAMTPITQFMHISAAETGLMTSSVLWGSAFAALLVGKLSDRFGRKRLLIAAATVFFIGALACFFVTHFWPLFIWRVFLGCGIGIASASVPSYLAELAPAAKRGTIATLFQMMIISGLLAAYTIDYFFLPVTNLGGHTNFQYMLGFAAIPAIILFIGGLVVPESPRFLVRKGQIKEATAILLHMRNNNQAEVEQEMQEIKEVAQCGSEGLATLLRTARPATIAACGLAILQQFIGINAALYYGPVIAGSVLPAKDVAGSIGALQHSQFIAIIFGIVNVLATAVAVLIMDKFKNKSLLYVGGAMMGIFAFVFAIVLGLDPHQEVVPAGLLIVFVCMYIIGFAFSWGPIIWNTIGEIFPLNVRGVGASIATFFNWAANGLVMTVFPVMIAQKADGSAPRIWFGFLVFGIFCFVAIVFTKKFVPETKGKSLEEIEAQLATTHSELAGESAK